ncbi:M50 family metallopeptidase [Cytobacillus sp. IB215316]|uniref:M50 family metallopeptidase n=1 Tax=Cytobacillus sp. IB215316 TaxID=3097354 RepID=UPI002A0B98AF|nr:M50 family metallopeptidase [Cytobacillus sp. IB215316]MDX8361514.1 M50 family metallopeptidase [Cytobacillus sp. IB215316]
MDIFLSLVVLFSLTIFSYVSVYIHEVGHYISALMLGAKQTKINIDFRKKPIFKTIINFGREMHKFEDAIVTSAGVFVQIIFSIIMIFQDYSLILKIIALLHLPTILINILPYYPLDGYYLRKISSKKNEIEHILLIIFYSCLLIFSSLLFQTLLYIYKDYPVLTITTLVIFIRIIMKIWKNKQYYKLRVSI